MRFSELNLKAKYDSDEDNILSSFHVPLLAYSKSYDRAVGYFSSEVLASAADGLEKFILSGGKMRLIIGDPLSDSEYEAVMEGLYNPILKRSEELSDLLLHTEDSKLRLLTYLVAIKQLDIKFAFTHKGMFHKKIGVFYQENEVVVFSGSANETLAGLSKYNSEEISVFFSWKESYLDYGQVEVDNFNKLWSNNKSRTHVVSLDSETYNKIQSNVDIPKLRYEIFKDICDGQNSYFFKYSFEKSEQKLILPDLDSKYPYFPTHIKGRPFELFTHQKLSINKWIDSDFKGLFKLATGSGKTFTSISAIVKLYELRHKEDKPTFVVISVPYIELANQWVRELSSFNINPVKCYENSTSWSETLENKLLLFRNKVLRFLCVVVVNNTLCSSNFQEKIRNINLDEMMFVGDECHHLGSEGLFKFLPDCKYRIGLSATPFRTDDEEQEDSPFPDISKKNLLSYFHGIVSDYSLNDAIRDGILSPYIYDLVPVYLNEEEQTQYEDYSSKIQKLFLKSKNSRLTAEEREMLTNLCGKRSRLLATCEGKLSALINYINQHQELSLVHSLIYVGEGKAMNEDIPYIQKVTNCLHENGCSVAKFTSMESNAERADIMNNFKKQFVHSLVAMKVLDEGIDVPVCKTAFILASTRNPRQYVQRRGRVLRKSPGKNEALIVDFIVLPQPGVFNNVSQNLRNAELRRIKDFKLTSLNSQDVEKKIIELGIF